LKYSYGAVMDVGAAKEDQLRTRITGLVRPVLEKMMAEMKRSLSFFQRTSGVKQMEKIYIVGGGACMRHLPLYLKSELDIDVEMFPAKRYFNFQKNLFQDLDEDMILNTLIPSCGLFINRTSHINLVPPQTRIFARIASYKHVVNLVMCSILGCMALVFGLFYLNYKEIQKTLSASEESLAELDDQARTIDELRSFKQNFLVRKTLVDGLVSSSPNWQWLLAELSRITPDAIVYDSMNIEITDDGGILTLIGIVDTKAIRLDKTISELMEKMGDSPFFSGMELVKMARNPAGARSAEAEFELKGFLFY
jgi:Tfp pilus assembly protein PilN